MITTSMLIAWNEYYNTRGGDANVPYIIEDDDDAALLDDGETAVVKFEGKKEKGTVKKEKGVG